MLLFSSFILFNCVCIVYANFFSFLFYYFDVLFATGGVSKNDDWGIQFGIVGLPSTFNV